MTFKSSDLLNHEPRYFLSEEKRFIALAFQEAWATIKPHVGSEPAEINTTRRWLADVVTDRAKHHKIVESLRNEVVYIAVQKALLRKSEL